MLDDVVGEINDVIGETLSPFIESWEEENGIIRLRKRNNFKMKNLSEKPFVVIDLGSGSYLAENEGHEKYNEIQNPITGKYYGYAPPHGGLDIKKLGARKSDNQISGVLVIYVKKVEDGNDRYISSFIDNATIYANPKIDKSLKRIIRKNSKTLDCSYSIESDEIYSFDGLPESERFRISLSDFSISMFRRQRFYKGKYPKLDKQLIDYLENLSSGDVDNDDLIFQQELQEVTEVSISKIKYNGFTEPEYNEGSNGRQVKKKIGVSKAALSLANYICEASPSHKTFMNKNGIQYMEGHHLVPCTATNASNFWNKFGVNIDCIENIICLCPTCHRLLHYGNSDERRDLLTKLYTSRIARLKKIGLNISLKELIALYS